MVTGTGILPHRSDWVAPAGGPGVVGGSGGSDALTARAAVARTERLRNGDEPFQTRGEAPYQIRPASPVRAQPASASVVTPKPARSASRFKGPVGSKRTSTLSPGNRSK